jgi:1-acyl-sn-glycerol-3-phosphate acyltransferase
MSATSEDSAEFAYGKFYPMAKALLGPARNLLWKIGVQGLEHVPDRGPAIVAANHISFLDSVFLLAVLPRRITFVGKSEYMDDWKTRYLFPGVGMIPIDRSGGDASRAALASAEKVLERGQLFGIFPEGTRSRSGLLYKGRTGVARLALKTGAPIIPAGIVGTDKIQPPDARFPRLFQPCSLSFGPPIDPTRYQKRAHDPRVARLITDEVMFELAQLTGQRYVDEYAGKTGGGDEADEQGAEGRGGRRNAEKTDDVPEGSGTGRSASGRTKTRARRAGDAERLSEVG